MKYNKIINLIGSENCVFPHMVWGVSEGGEMTKINIQTETIICPRCGSREEAMASQSGAEWWAYVHWCFGCGYCIMESEWELAN